MIASIAIERKLSQYLSKSSLKQRRTASGKYRHMLTLQKEAVLKKMNTKEKVPEITPNNLKNIKKKLYKDLKHSLDPVIYEILYQIIEKITVSNEGVEIELTI